MIDDNSCRCAACQSKRRLDEESLDAFLKTGLSDEQIETLKEHWKILTEEEEKHRGLKPDE